MLTPTDHEVHTETGTNYLTYDPEQNKVIVSVSHEALADCDTVSIWDAASAKYAQGDFSEAQGNLTVRVTSADCS